MSNLSLAIIVVLGFFLLFYIKIFFPTCLCNEHIYFFYHDLIFGHSNDLSNVIRSGISWCKENAKVIFNES